jgi:hypothetical protein
MHACEISGYLSKAPADSMLTAHCHQHGKFGIPVEGSFLIIHCDKDVTISVEFVIAVKLSANSTCRVMVPSLPVRLGRPAMPRAARAASGNADTPPSKGDELAPSHELPSETVHNLAYHQARKAVHRSKILLLMSVQGHSRRSNGQQGFATCPLCLQ